MVAARHNLCLSVELRDSASGDQKGSRVCLRDLRCADTPITALGCTATLPEQTVTGVRRAAPRLEVSHEIAALTVIGTSIASMEGHATVPITLVAPERDGPGEADMIGLLADVRQLNVCTEALSFAGAALRLHHVVKERICHAPSTDKQFPNTFVNLEGGPGAASRLPPDCGGGQTAREQ